LPADGRREIVRDSALIAALACAAYAPAVAVRVVLDFEDHDFVWGNPAVTAA